MKKALNIFVSGTLKKTGFRFYCMQKAVELGIKGTVSYTGSKNIIVIIAEGEEKDLKKFLEWCSTGTPSCRVTEIETHEIGLKNYSGFDIVNK
ncbi:MAG: acylphosphatase [Bacteroidales bacterium]|nr:acylphosphatase [Bacteroidales bacterium]